MKCLTFSHLLGHDSFAQRKGIRLLLNKVINHCLEVVRGFQLVDHSCHKSLPDCVDQFAKSFVPQMLLKVRCRMIEQKSLVRLYLLE